MSNLLTLFRRNQQRETTAEVVVAPKTAADAAVMPTTAVSKDRRNALGIKAVVDGSTVIHGPIETRNSALIDGTIEGSVTVTGTSRMALLRETCHVQGNVTAPIVMVAGEVRGDIVGRAVRLFRTAVVHGSITAERLGIDAGATIGSGLVLCGEAAAKAVREAMDERPAAAAGEQPASDPAPFVPRRERVA